MVGTIGYVTDAFLLFLVLRYTSLNALQGRAISFLVAVFVTWRLNRKFTFATAKNLAGHAGLEEFARYLAANFLGISMNLGIYTILVLKFPFFSASPQFAVAAGSIAALTVNFMLSNYWVFK